MNFHWYSGFLLCSPSIVTDYLIHLVCTVAQCIVYLDKCDVFFSRQNKDTRKPQLSFILFWFETPRVSSKRFKAELTQKPHLCAFNPEQEKMIIAHMPKLSSSFFIPACLLFIPSLFASFYCLFFLVIHHLLIQII